MFQKSNLNILNIRILNYSYICNQNLLNFYYILIQINSIIKKKNKIETYSKTKLHTHTNIYNGFRKKRIKAWKRCSKKVSQTFQKRNLMKQMSKFKDIIGDNWGNNLPKIYFWLLNLYRKNVWWGKDKQNIVT